MTMQKLLIASLLAASFISLDAAADDYEERSEARALVERLAVKGVDRAWALRIIADAEYQDHIVEAMDRPAERVLAWYEYRRIFLKPTRIEGGADFIRKHEAVFEQVERAYGVPRALIAAIIGVETRYGGYIGKDRVLDALATLGFDYPSRSEFFTSELEHFLLLSREEGIDPLTAVGSYAGAMGLPQFIASSYRAYAVDFNKNGKRDLWNEPGDIIASVANYFTEHGWEYGSAVAIPATVADEDLVDDLERSKRKTHYPFKTLARSGVVPKAPIDGETRVGLVELEAENGPEFWVGLNNFFVITSYNHSTLYAMAVYQLSQAIEASYQSAKTAQR